MKMNNIIPEVRIEIKPSKLLKGEVGVFTTRSFETGGIVIPAKHFNGMKMHSWSDLKKYDVVTKEKILAYCPGSKEGFLAPKDLNYLSIAWHMNHSCKPNIGFDDQYNFISIRNIKKGEELVWDYGFDETNPDFKMQCQCMSKKCRKTITGNDWKLLSQTPSNYSYLSPHVKKLLKKLK